MKAGFVYCCSLALKTSFGIWSPNLWLIIFRTHSDALKSLQRILFKSLTMTNTSCQLFYTSRCSSITATWIFFLFSFRPPHLVFRSALKLHPTLSLAQTCQTLPFLFFFLGGEMSQVPGKYLFVPDRVCKSKGHHVFVCPPLLKVTPSRLDITSAWSSNKNAEWENIRLRSEINSFFSKAKKGCFFFLGFRSHETVAMTLRSHSATPCWMVNSADRFPFPLNKMHGSTECQSSRLSCGNVFAWHYCLSTLVRIWRSSEDSEGKSSFRVSMSNPWLLWLWALNLPLCLLFYILTFFLLGYVRTTVIS